MTATRERFAMADLTGGELNALVKKVGGTGQVRELLRDDINVVITTLTPKNLKQPGSLDDLRDRFDKALGLLKSPQPGNAAWHGSLNEHLLYIKSCLHLGFPKMPANMQVWKTIKLGTGIKDGAGFKKALKDGGYRVSDWANDILGKPAFKASDTEREVELVLVTAKDLGLPNGGTRAEIYKRADENGLDPCPPEVGPQLRLQYTDQPKYEWMLIGMEPIADSDGDLGVFHVGHGDDGQWLRTGYGSPGRVWGAGNRWVFLRRK